MITTGSLLLDIRQSNQIVFVCSGNIVRSAFAELYAKHIMESKVKLSIRSLGTDYHNSNILDKTRTALIDRGLDPIKVENFRPTHISKYNSDEINDRIFFSMTNHHQAQLLKYFGRKIKSYLLTNVINENLEIEDPYFTNNFDRVFLKIENCINQLIIYCIN